MLVTGSGLAGSPGDTDGGSAAAGSTRSALVQLNGAPLSTDAKTKPPKGKKIDFTSGTVKSYRAQLNNLRNDFKRWLRDNAPAVKVTGEFDISLNAVAVQLNGTALATLRAAPMVAGVQFQAVYTPQAHDDPDLALFTPTRRGREAAGAKGSGVKVAIVDSGIDARPRLQGRRPIEGNGEDEHWGRLCRRLPQQGRQPGLSRRPTRTVTGRTSRARLAATSTSRILDGITVDYDPRAWLRKATLGNFNVFPDDVASARSKDIVNALERPTRGLPRCQHEPQRRFQGFNDLLSMAVDNLDQANMVSAVAAGNGGQQELRTRVARQGSPGRSRPAR